VTGAAERRIVFALNDLIRFADTASRLVARGRSAYESDEAVRLAAEAILHKIGEAVTRLPEEFIVAYPDVAWRSMKATRNIVAHEYEQVDYDIIWNALAHRLPVEADRIRQILTRIDTH
jgi:uncharacterized protein with HEPN domain